MEVLRSYDNSRIGNDCYISEIYALVRVLGKTRILKSESVSGWCEQDLCICVVSESDVSPDVLQGLGLRKEVEPRDKDVHTEHCCKVCGCKYGDSYCTVAAGTRDASYPCEFCDYSL